MSKFRLPTKLSSCYCTKQTPTYLPTYPPTFLHAHSPYPPTFLPTLSPFFIRTYPHSTYHPCTSVPTYLARLKHIVPYDHFTGRNSSSCGIEGKRSRARAKFWLRFVRKWSCIFFWSWLEIIFYILDNEMTMNIMCSSRKLLIPPILLYTRIGAPLEKIFTSTIMWHYTIMQELIVSAIKREKILLYM